MSAVNIISVIPENCEAKFTDPFSFSIEYNSLYALQADLEWKMTYVGSPESEIHDQELSNALVGPVLQGCYKFVFEGDPPDPAKIPAEDLIGVTVIFLTCSYKSKEFIRIGYFVNVEYSQEALKENPPDVPLIAELKRCLLIDHPRVTRFPVNFDNDDVVPEVAPVGVQDESMAMGDVIDNAQMQDGQVEMMRV